MSRRFKRPEFDMQAWWDPRLRDEARNQLLFDWWCDDDDRAAFIRELPSAPQRIPSRAPVQLDPAPPQDQPTPQGFADVFLLSDPDHVRRALTDHANFSNAPYAALGGANFLLAMDPGEDASGIDWHDEQKKLVAHLLGTYSEVGLRELAALAVEQAALTSLAQPVFDLAGFAEQATLRAMGTLWGYAFQDHALLEDASRATYRALVYLAVGQHFVSEPGTLPAAQQALGRLVTRSSQLTEDFTRLARSPRLTGWVPGRAWPRGVQPWSELGLCGPLGMPILKYLPRLDSALNGRQRIAVVATLLAGTVGNIVSAVCLLVQALMADDKDRAALRAENDDVNLERKLQALLARTPPLPVVPRRARKHLTLGGVSIAEGADCLVLLEGRAACPHVWGDVPAGGPGVATHPCLGTALAMPLIAALVRHTLRLPGLKPALDRLTGEVLEVERRWGFACTSYPLRYERERRRVQSNLIVSMRVKSPIGENAAKLRRVIAGAVPRIDQVLTGFGHLHFAWFEFSDDDSHLVLRTIYDGAFEPYVQHFALQAGDLFDGLFEFIEHAPPRPVAEHPYEFVETIKRFNRAPLAGYLYSAYPRTQADQIRGRTCGAP